MLIALVTSACAGGSGSTDTSTVEAKPFERFLPDGPVHGVFVTNGLEERDAPLQPKSTFAMQDPSVTAVVPLGAVGNDATLTIEWRRMGAGIDEAEVLFVHEVEVEDFQSAFSVGVSEGQLDPGVYEVVASLDTHEVSALWRVASEPASPETTSSDSAPPVAGDSGVIAASAASTEADCSDLEVAMRAPILWLVDYLVLADGGSLAAVECRTVILSATVVGPPMVVAEYSPNFSDMLDPCRLPGGSDMPGTTVHFSARYADDPAEAARAEHLLEDPEEPPVVVLQSIPRNGSRVEPGDTIRLQSQAMEIPPSEGLHWAEIRSPGGVLGREEHQATPCVPSRFFSVMERTYTVPADPPPVIELTAVAQDFDGVDSTDSVTFVTDDRQVWEGTMTAETERQYEGAGGCFDTWRAELDFVVDPEGTIDGTGRAELGEFGCELPSSNPAQAHVFSIGGQSSDDALTLLLSFGHNVPAGSNQWAGFPNLLLTSAGQPGGGPPGPPLVIPKVDECRARGRVTETQRYASNDPTVAEATFDLRCAIEPGRR